MWATVRNIYAARNTVAQTEVLREEMRRQGQVCISTSWILNRDGISSIAVFQNFKKKLAFHVQN